MYAGLKEAWEFHIMAGEKVKFPTLSTHDRASALSVLRALKSKSVRSFLEFGMTDLAEELQQKSIKTALTDEGFFIWLENKPERTIFTFEVVT